MRVQILVRADGKLAGERLPYLVNDDGQIDAYSMMWSATRRSIFTPNTRKTALNAIIQLRLWSKLTSVNVEQEMVYGSCLSHEQVEDLMYYIGHRRKDLVNLTKTRPLDLNRFLAQCEPVSSETENLRRVYVNDYLLWLGSYGNLILQKTGQANEELMKQRRARLAPKRRNPNQRQANYLSGSISGQIMGGKRRAMGSRMQQATPDEVNQFALFFSSSTRDELWSRNKDRALRNELLIKLLLQTGGRVSELLALKDTDLVHGKNMIQFARRHNDPEDPRKDNPTLKTHDRQMRLSDGTWDLLMEWLDVQDEVTSHDPQAFLFVNLSRNPKYYGQPMTRTAVDQLIREVCKKAEIKPFGAHQLRHLYVRELAQHSQDQGWTDEEWRKAATYLLGWSNSSSMPALYLGEAANQQADMQMKLLWTERGLGVE